VAGKRLDLRSQHVIFGQPGVETGPSIFQGLAKQRKCRVGRGGTTTGRRAPTPQTFEFQAEIKQLLDIVIHSLYTEKEIFVRELVSNASDALEKLRHLQLTEKEIFDDKLDLEINITTDDKAKTFTIQDFGVGMTRAELIENLGTIAHSGSKAFLKALGERRPARTPA
jgi:hypothetical protein